MKKKKNEHKIQINNINNLKEQINISSYYNIFCQKTVSKYYFLYKKYLASQAIELEDLKQEILLMIWEILVKNSKDKKISDDNIGGYLFNATKWRLNSILSKAVTTYKHNISETIFNIDNISKESEERNLRNSERILILFCDQNDANLVDILNKVCTKKEALATEEYYFYKLNSVDIAKKMKISPQRVSSLINSALLKLNFYFTQFITNRSDDE